MSRNGGSSNKIKINIRSKGGTLETRKIGILAQDNEICLKQDKDSKFWKMATNRTAKSTNNKKGTNVSGTVVKSLEKLRSM